MTSGLDPFTYILDSEHRPINCRNDDDWFNWFLDMKNRRVGWTELADGRIIVSTVFIGIDRSYGRARRPLVFETHIICDGEHTDEWMTATWQEAEAKHAEAVRLVEQEK